MSLAVMLITASLFMTEMPDTLGAAKVTSRREGTATSTAPIRSIGAAAIERSGAVSLHEVLRTFAGVSIKDYGGIGGLKTVSVRSLGAQHTSVTYDGVPVSDAQNGSIDISRFSTEHLAEIAMEIGGADDIFRNARTLNSAGTLVLRSQKPDFSDSATKLIASMRYGSFQTYRPSVRLERRLAQKWGVSASADWTKSDGAYPFTLANGKETVQQQRLGSDVSILNSELNIYGEELQAKLNWRSSERGLPGQVIYYTQDPTERLWDRDLSSSLNWEHGWNEKWRSRSTLSFTRSANRYLDVSAKYQQPEDDHYLQRELAGSCIIGFTPIEKLEFAFAEDLFANVLDSDIPECVFPRRITSITAISGKYHSQRLTVVSSISGTLAHEWVGSGSPAPDRRRLSPSVSASYELFSGLRFRASYRDGFRMPTFNDLYYARVGNTSLRPEIAKQTNLGVTWTAKGITITADGYYGNVKDKIVAVPTMFIWKMHNIGEVEMSGLDLTALYHASLSEGMRAHLSMSYSFQHAVDITDPSAKNYRHQIQYTPRHSGSGIATLETPWCDLTYTLNAVGIRYFLTQNIKSNALDPYFDHSLTLARGFKVRKVFLRLSLDALNLAGKNYEVVHGYPMPGRNYRMNLKISYK